ncbi:putative membrane insertase OXA1/ALB3/YidC, tetratricopeptide-like helical domain-containing protein [Rosa chinensis]|uniref:Putative membrane insertase OXA1/ALB3/YidC, tetratricopeptide-like helical domain-containing protein n=1 Tax=Rosa chinensis TaxID=74649 RepID=A0A2P6R5A8_ROSCH|nr:ALBINO3-like protein 2, chloroplastic [Rosa chinensis]PRQ41569.1 putative membrane insertase OXA1/ALB3/YidC, tetratricopeptide-like helical domain-containing protein [Rosa chinensis]
MATSSKLFRRLRPSFNFLPALSHSRQFHLLSNPIPIPIPKSNSNTHLRNAFAFNQTLASSHSRFFSSASPDESDFGRFGGDSDSATQFEVLDFGATASGEESLLPVQGLISVLDHFHELTGLPWWIVIASSTVAMRVALLPLLIVQLKKLKRIGELSPKLPPPLPPMFSGKSYTDHISVFRKERREIGCPSFLWFLAYFSVQIPCFFLWLTTIRRMSLDNHPGFDCGGTLWFQNLSELPHGVSGPIFPLLIAGLHYANVQISFKASSLKTMKGVFGTLAKYYKYYLNFITLPLFFIGYNIPQGSLVYWVTNSSISVIQQLALKDPAVRAKLGLPDNDRPTETENSEKLGIPELSPLASPTKMKKISLQNLSPKELVNLSIQVLSEGDKERALPLLGLALEKDPEYVRALIVMGQTLLQKELHAEATKYLERAITKLFSTGVPTRVEDIDNLILASQWTGVAYIRQGKFTEGIVHLDRIAQLKEPDDPKSKAHYFDGLLMLASALSNVGRKDEALKHLRLAAAYNPAYNEYVEQCENEDDGLVSDLASSRRSDY